MPPRGPVALASATADADYIEGLDYTLDRDSGILTRTPESRIPQATAVELHPSVDPDGSGFMHVRGQPNVFLLVDEGGAFHKRQVTASYSFDVGQWTGYVPGYAGVDLPSTADRLRRKDALTLCLLGDSISEGCNASGFMGIPPYQQPFGPLVAAGLQQVYGSAIRFRNFATAGWTSDDGLGAVGAVAAERPNLVLVAFGMNDAGYADPVDYAANIAAIIERIRTESPHTEFVLISSMLPNPEWHYPQMERFDGYSRTLDQLCGPGVILADVTRLWNDVTVRKSVYDLTGNGINHPNDFGHRLYAQVILSRLVE